MDRLTKNNKKILNLLADYPNRGFFTKEIADKLKISLGGAHNSLKELVKAKLVLLEQKGNMKFFRMNSRHPLVKQLRSAIIVEGLLPLLDKIKKDCLEIRLFGSAARGEQSAESDIDLFILSNSPQAIKKILPKKVQQMPLKAIIRTPVQWGEMEIKEPEFFREVKQGLKLYEPAF